MSRSKIGSHDGCKKHFNCPEVGKDTSDRAKEKNQKSFSGLSLKKGEAALVFKVGHIIAGWTGSTLFVEKWQASCRVNRRSPIDSLSSGILIPELRGQPDSQSILESKAYV